MTPNGSIPAGILKKGAITQCTNLTTMQTFLKKNPHLLKEADEWKDSFGRKKDKGDADDDGGEDGDDGFRGIAENHVIDWPASRCGPKLRAFSAIAPRRHVLTAAAGRIPSSCPPLPPSLCFLFHCFFPCRTCRLLLCSFSEDEHLLSFGSPSVTSASSLFPQRHTLTLLIYPPSPLPLPPSFAMPTYLCVQVAPARPLPYS